MCDVDRNANLIPQVSPRQIKKASRDAPDIKKLVDSWSRFVASIEEGYKLGFYDYTNDTSIRNRLNKLTTSKDANIDSDTLKSIVNLDRRYFEVTTEVDEPLLATRDGRPREQWWWYRIPKVLNKKLASDFLMEGIISQDRVPKSD